MKKTLLYVPLIASLITPLAFALEPEENACMQKIDEHYAAEWNYLDLTKCNLHDKDITIINAFSEKHHVTGLSLNENQITELGATELAKNKTVEFLRISNNTINAKGAIELAKNKVLRDLELVSTGIGDAGLIALSHNENLKSLMIGTSKSSIGTDKFSVEAAAEIANNTTLKHLAISKNAFDHSGIAQLAKNKTLTGLQLYKFELDTNDLHVLTKMTALIGLDILYSNISDDGAKIIATDSNLTGLTLINTNISDEGLIEFAKMPKLKVIELSNDRSNMADYPLNHVTVKGIETLVKSTSLEWLALADNNIDDESAAVIAGSPTINVLILNHNNIGNAGAIALAKSASLGYLDVSYNHIGQLGKETLAANFYIESLYIEGNDGELKAKQQPFTRKHCKFSPELCNPSVVFSSQYTRK